MRYEITGTRQGTLSAVVMASAGMASAAAIGGSSFSLVIGAASASNSFKLSDDLMTQRAGR